MTKMQTLFFCFCLDIDMPSSVISLPLHYFVPHWIFKLLKHVHIITILIYCVLLQVDWSRARAIN